KARSNMCATTSPRRRFINGCCPSSSRSTSSRAPSPFVCRSGPNSAGCRAGPSCTAPSSLQWSISPVMPRLLRSSSTASRPWTCASITCGLPAEASSWPLQPSSRWGGPSASSMFASATTSSGWLPLVAPPTSPPTCNRAKNAAMPQKLHLTMACGLYDRMLDLYRGDVRPDGIELNFIPMDGSAGARETFDRMARLEFDIAEMSSSEFIGRKSAGHSALIALPVFPSRVFRQGMLSINRRSGIASPKDLEGKRVGVPIYSMSAAVWMRGHLQDDYGVDLGKIQWVEGAINEPGPHGHPSLLPLLRPLSIEQNSSGKSLSDLLESGGIDAILV